MDSAMALPPTLTRPARHLFLSPHYDDIPLSVGATVRLLSNEGIMPDSLVVFGSEPDPEQPLTPFARQLHDAWGLDASDVIASRRAEESAAAAILGASTGVLPFRDAIYRGDLYLSDDDLFGVPAAAESALPTEIISALGLPSSPDTAIRFYAPLGVGRHVDHQTVFRAGVELAQAGWDVWFYEDIPYALKPDALDSRLADFSQSTPMETAALVPAEPTWERKLDAILKYPSQLETVFRSYVGIGTTRCGDQRSPCGVRARAWVRGCWRSASGAFGSVDPIGELTADAASGRVYVRRWCGPDHGGRERNPPRIPACGSPFHPVGAFTRELVRPARGPVGRTSARSGLVRDAGGGSAVALQRDAAEVHAMRRAARACRRNRVTAGRESLPNTAHHPPEAPMTASAVAGASPWDTQETRSNELQLNPSSMLGNSTRNCEPLSHRNGRGVGVRAVRGWGVARWRLV